MKIALYDIDYTIISINSLLYFYLFIFQKKKTILFYLPILLILTFLSIFRILTLDKLKSYWLLPLKNIPKKKLEEYSEEFVKRDIIPKLKSDALKNISIYKKKKYKIIFATASFELYMKYLAEYLKADYFFGTRTAYKNNNIIPKIIGKNCKGKEKIERILMVIKKTQIDKINSVGFSDSKSDLPYLELVSNLNIVSKKNWIFKERYRK